MDACREMNIPVNRNRQEFRKTLHGDPRDLFDEAAGGGGEDGSAWGNDQDGGLCLFASLVLPQK